jgi:hypothetical protein
LSRSAKTFALARLRLPMRGPIGFVARVHRRTATAARSSLEAALGAGDVMALVYSTAFGLDEGGSLHALSKQAPCATRREIMNELLELTVKAHGGLDRWRHVTSIRVPPVQDRRSTWRRTRRSRCRRFGFLPQGSILASAAEPDRNAFNVQRHLTSAQSHRVLRTAAMSTWREVVAAA